MHPQQFMALAQKKMVGHSGNVIANDAMAWFARRQLRMIRRHTVGVVEEKAEERVERLHRAVAIFNNGRIRIEMRVQESLQASAILGDVRRKSREPLGPAPAIIYIFHS